MPFDQPETPAGQIAFELSSPGVEKRFLAVMQEMAARFERFDRVASRIETIAEDIRYPGDGREVPVLRCRRCAGRRGVAVLRGRVRPLLCVEPSGR
jgi:hypothetical protein